MDAQARSIKAEIHNVVDRLTIPKLKFALKVLSLSTSGRKNQLQERILWTLRDKPIPYLQGMYRLVLQADEGNEGSPVWRPPAPTYMPRPHSYTAQANNLTDGHGQLPPGFYPSNPATNARPYPLGGSVGGRPGNYGPHPVQPQFNGAPGHHPSQPRNFAHSKPLSELKFVQQPFYTIKRQMSPLAEFRTPHMTPILQVQLALRIPDEALPQLKETCRLVVLCQRTTPDGDARPIYYPFNSEVYVNEQRVDANVRGIKGQEGSARPVDITRMVLRSTHRDNRVLFKFQVHSDPNKDDGTKNKSFALGVYMIQQRTIAEIVAELEARPPITKSASLASLKDDDDDIQQMESNHSLKDPIMCVRMTLPVRSRNCEHIDCVDATQYMTFQQQAPTWKCPHCNKPITYDSLAVDSFMLEILRSSKPTVDRVTVSPEGTWKVQSTDSSDEYSSDDEPPAKRAKQQPEVIDLLDSEDDLEQDVAQALAAPSVAPLMAARAQAPQAPQALPRLPPLPAQHGAAQPRVPEPVQPPPERAALATRPQEAPQGTLQGAPQGPLRGPVMGTFDSAPRATANGRANIIHQSPQQSHQQVPQQASRAPGPAHPGPATPTTPAELPSRSPGKSPVSAVLNPAPPQKKPAAAPGPSPGPGPHGPWSDPTGVNTPSQVISSTQPNVRVPTVPPELGFDATNYTVQGPNGAVQLPSVYELPSGGVLSGDQAKFACLEDLKKGRLKVISRPPYFMPVDMMVQAPNGGSGPSGRSPVGSPGLPSSDEDIVLNPELVAASQHSPVKNGASSGPSPAPTGPPATTGAPSGAPAGPTSGPSKFDPASILASAERKIQLYQEDSPAPAAAVPAGTPQTPAAPAAATPPMPKFNSASLQNLLGGSLFSAPSQAHHPAPQQEAAQAPPARSLQPPRPQPRPQPPKPAQPNFDVIDLTGDSD